LLFQLQHLVDGRIRFRPRPLDEPAGVDDDKIRARRFRHQPVPDDL